MAESLGCRSPSLTAVTKIVCWSLGALLLLGAATAYLESVPPVFWDEGWTLSVARNWVELGHYGRLSLGKEAPHGLQAAYPVTMSVALAFKYFGIGLFQARLVFVGYFLAALATLFVLACRFYDRRVAVATLVVLLLSGGLENHPLLMARQVFGEIPALFFLLAGYLCFLRAGEKPGLGLYMLGSIVCWSLAIITKVQVLPFWFASLVLPLVAEVFLRRWSIVKSFAVGLIGVGVVAYFSQQFISQSLIPAPSSISGLAAAIGLVGDSFRRLIALVSTVEIGLPTFLGLLWAARNLIRKDSLESHAAAVRLAYLILAGTWFAWYELFSVGWARYLFPAMFLASIFVAVMIRDWTDGFQLIGSLRRTAAGLARFQYSQHSLYVIVALVLIGWSIAQTASDLRYAMLVGKNDRLRQTVEYINKNIPSAAIIETYDAELLFFLRHRYHYPPDQVNVELIRQRERAEKPAINYDPLQADPDYLVVGPWCAYFKCYDAVLSGNAFQFVTRFGPYQIFARVR